MNELSKLEKGVLTVMGPNHVVWNVGELSRKLVDNGIRDVMDLPKLKNFLSKRPALFTVMDNHVWSKLESIEDLKERPVKSPKTISVYDSELVDKALAMKILGLMSSRKAYGESWSINQLLSMMKLEVLGFDKLNFEQRSFTKFLRNRPDYFKVQNSGQHVQVAISFRDHIKMEKYFQQYQENHPKTTTEVVNKTNPWNKNKKFEDYTKENQGKKVPKKYVNIDPVSGFVFPKNSLLNPIANLMNNCPHTSENSTRITVASRTAIMFKTQWVYDHLPLHSKRAWRTSKDLTRELEKDPDFYSGSQSCHLKEIISKSPHPDFVARCILDLILDNEKETVTAQDIFNKVPATMKSFLKTLKGVRGFVEFYPALFHLNGDDIGAAKEPLWKEDLTLPNLTNPSSISDYDQKALNSVVTLMTMSHAMPTNALVFVIENLDKNYLSIDWVHDRLPKNIKERFKSPSQLYGFFMKFKGTFVLLGKFVQLKSTLRNLPCDKSTSLEIIKLQRNGSNAMKELYTKLPDSCRPRIRSESELKKFLKLYCDFHYDVDWFNQQLGVSQKILAPSTENSTASPVESSEPKNGNDQKISPLPELTEPFIVSTGALTSNYFLDQDHLVQDEDETTEEDFYNLLPSDVTRDIDTILEL